MANFDITPYVHMHPRQVRELIRNQTITFPTAGMAAGYAQANLVILPGQWAADDLQHGAGEGILFAEFLEIRGPLAGQDHEIRLCIARGHACGGEGDGLIADQLAHLLRVHVDIGGDVKIGHGFLLTRFWSR